MTELRWRNVSAIPLIHGRLPFALEVRRTLLGRRVALVAVELPPSLAPAMDRALDLLPQISVVLYRERPAFLDPEDDRLWYVPIDPADGIIEALRIARGERTPVAFVDAEVEAFRPRPLDLPDPHAIGGLGLLPWYRAVRPELRLLPPSAQDHLRERHMAARLAALSEEVGPDAEILFIGGLAHWSRLRSLLQTGDGELHAGEGPAPELVTVERLHPRSIQHAVGEMPWIVHAWEGFRAGIDPGDYDPVEGLKRLLVEARGAYEAAFPDSLESADTGRLAMLLRYLRKLTVRSRRLFPDTWLLTLAAKGTVGNDFAVTLLETANRYPPNEVDPEDTLRMTETLGRVDDAPRPLATRTPGAAREFRPLELRRRPDRRRAREWQTGWNPHASCSWPPEDVVIENFRDYVTRRALTMAGLSLRKTEPFLASLKDGVAIRETLRDWHLGKIHVKEEPRVAGEVGALVAIFEEDDDGTRFPWRLTWQAEHENESTLAFYATDPKEDMIGPGIGRMFYGGCMFIFPPMPMPEVWDDLRFEQARRPSERLLLAALWYSRDKYVAHLGPTPPAPEVQEQAARLGKHVVHLPLTSFSAQTLEKLRRAHVLNGQQVRSWADRFIH